MVFTVNNSRSCDTVRLSVLRDNSWLFLAFRSKSHLSAHIATVISSTRGPYHFDIVDEDKDG